jgi:general secretion pathway protein I
MRTERQGRARRAAGFTLLEVLVATAVLGTAVAALFSLLSGSLANVRRLEGPEQALSLARTQMNELLATGDQGAALPPDQTIEGRWNDRFRWEAEATRVPAATQAAPGELVLVRVVLHAFWKSESSEREKQLTLESYQLRREPARSAP